MYLKLERANFSNTGNNTFLKSKEKKTGNFQLLRKHRISLNYIKTNQDEESSGISMQDQSLHGFTT